MKEIEKLLLELTKDMENVTDSQKLIAIIVQLKLISIQFNTLLNILRNEN